MQVCHVQCAAARRIVDLVGQEGNAWETHMPGRGPEHRDGTDVNLVLEGGGVKGIGIIGAVLALDEAGFRFRRVAGTSAGAIAAALVAANIAAGASLADVKDQIGSVDYRRFTEGHTGRIGQFKSLVTKLGMFPGDYLVAWLGGILDDLGVTKFGDLRRDGLGDVFPYSLVVHTADITRGRLVRLPHDYSHYGKDPDEERIVDAVRASMAIPFFFEPVRVDFEEDTDGGPRVSAKATWVDGGLLSNFPMETFNDLQNGVVVDAWNTIGVKLSDKVVSQKPLDPTDGVVEELHQILKTLLDNSNRYFVPPDKQRGTIFVDSAGIDTTDFDLTVEQQETLFGNGQQAARDWLLELAKFAPTPTAHA
jgi:NTE family protein